MKAAAAFILGLSLAVVATPNPAGGKKDRVLYLNTRLPLSRQGRAGFRTGPDNAALRESVFLGYQAQPAGRKLLII